MYTTMPALHLRITTTDYTIIQVEDFIKTLSPDKYIVAQETVPYNHYHCHFNYDIANFTGYQKRKLGKVITEHFSLSGNKQYGISEDRGKSEIYTVKDGKYVSNGYTEEEIKSLYSQSKTKVKFKDQLDDLKQSYIEGGVSFEKYVTSYIELHTEYLKPLSDFRLQSHFQTMYFVRNPSQIQSYAETFIHKISTNYQSY